MIFRRANTDLTGIHPLQTHQEIDFTFGEIDIFPSIFDHEEITKAVEELGVEIGTPAINQILTVFNVMQSEQIDSLRGTCRNDKDGFRILSHKHRSDQGSIPSVPAHHEFRHWHIHQNKRRVYESESRG